MTSSTTVKAPTGHEDAVHDAQLDYYGLRLATCSSDHTVKIFDVHSVQGSAPQIVFSCNLLGHTGPVWEVAWAHPRWGTLLASCSYDANVILHRQDEATGVWQEVYRYSANASVNTIEWCPIEYGLALALASSDGTVAVLRCDAGGQGEWRTEASFVADKLGLNSVSWAPFGSLGSVSAVDGSTIMRLATGGCDETVKIWKCEWTQDEMSIPVWQSEGPEFTLKGHTGWVRDVAFCPSVGLPYNLLATCAEDGSVKLWSQEREAGEWLAMNLCKLKVPVWRVAWSISGNLLAVSAGEEDVTLWKESVEEKKWIQVVEIKDDAPPPIVPAPAPVAAEVAEPVVVEEEPVQVEHKLDQFAAEEEEEPVSEDIAAQTPAGASKEAAWDEFSGTADSNGASYEEQHQQQQPEDAAWDEQPTATEEYQGQAAWDEQQAGASGGGWDEQQPQQGWDQSLQEGVGGNQEQEWTPEQIQAWEQQQQQQQQGGWDQQGWDQQGWDQQQQEGSWGGEQEWTPEQIQEWEQQQQQQQQWQQ